MFRMKYHLVVVPSECITKETDLTLTVTGSTYKEACDDLLKKIKVFKEIKLCEPVEYEEEKEQLPGGDLFIRSTN